MAEKKFRSVIGSLSIGLVFVMAQIWMFTQSSILFPENSEAWKSVILTYMVITAFVFSWNSFTGEELFRAKFLKRGHVFLLGAIITFLLLYVIGNFIGTESLPSITMALAGIPLGTLLLHGLIVSVDEELIFRGFLMRELRKSRAGKITIYFVQAVAFSMFHYAVAGGEWLLLAIYIPLGIIFAFIKDKWSPTTNLANMGAHFGWNAFILGFGSLI